METLTEARIEPIGTLKIKSDATAPEFFEGLGSFVTFEDREGDRLIDAVVVSQEELQAMKELTSIIAAPSFPAATEVREYIEERLDNEVSWHKIANRYEQMTNGR